MKRWIIGSGVVLCSMVVISILYWLFFTQKTLQNPIVGTPKVQTPLLAYSFENLRTTSFPQSQIQLHGVLSQTNETIAESFSFTVPAFPGKEERKTVSGVVTRPKNAGTYPVIILFRGFVPPESYKPGIGTQPVATVFAKNGFITIAPDFLGYGESDAPASDPFEARFQTYTTALSLFASLETLKTALQASGSTTLVDTTRVGVWGHSNGGHIALSAVAISGKKYPTVLWAPVTKAFPYSILAYTDESDDQGKALRSSLYRFESLYDVDLFSPPQYYSWIQAPLSVYQGTADEEVPVWWTREFVSDVQQKKKQIELHTYPNADHNLRPTGWSNAVTESMQFFTKEFAQTP